VNVNLDKCNLTHDEASAHLYALLTRNRTYYEAVRVRCVAARYGDEWRNVLCVVHTYPKAACPAKKTSQHFGDLSLLEMWLDLKHYLGFLTKMPDGSFPWSPALGIDGCPVRFRRANRLNRYSFQPSRNAYCDYPGVIYEAGPDDPITLPSGPLFDASSGQFYSKAMDAIGQWGEIKDFHPYIDARCYGMLHFVPECRSRIGSVQKDGPILRVTIKTADGLDLGLKLIGEVRCGDRCVPVNQVLHGASDVEIDAATAEFVELYLFDEQSNPCDFYRQDVHEAREVPQELPTQNDAFISYRRCEPDRTFAHELLRELEAAGFRVAIDERDFSPQATFLEEMERCIRESRFTLAVLSPRYLNASSRIMRQL
jgi:TIR domain